MMCKIHFILMMKNERKHLYVPIETTQNIADVEDKIKWLLETDG